MGRNKIAIKTIENKRQKGITFHRRKHGLIKKAHELSVLTGARVAVLMFDAKDECHLVSYSDLMFILITSIVSICSILQYKTLKKYYLITKKL
jgi:hypothetical protein